MRNLPAVLLLSYLAVASGQVFAQPDYRCVVERVHGSAPDTDPVIAQERNNYVGKEFTVDRASGVMIGSLKNSFLTRPQVIDRGSRDNSFKAITTMRVEQGVGGGSAVYTLVINEFVESTRKPFLFLSVDVVYFGNCSHFR